jgi:hypothetical protein
VLEGKLEDFIGFLDQEWQDQIEVVIHAGLLFEG